MAVLMPDYIVVHCASIVYVVDYFFLFLHKNWNPRAHVFIVSALVDVYSRLFHKPSNLTTNIHTHKKLIKNTD